MDGDVKYRIGIFAGAILLYLAIVCDLIELLLDVLSVGTGGWIIDVIEILLIAPIFYFNGVHIFSGRLGPQWFVIEVVSFIPYVSTFVPEMVIGVVIAIAISRKEDRDGVGDQGDLVGVGENLRDRYKKVRDKNPIRSKRRLARGKLGKAFGSVTRTKRVAPPPLPKSKPPRLPGTPPPLPKQPPPLPKTESGNRFKDFRVSAKNKAGTIAAMGSEVVAKPNNDNQTTREEEDFLRDSNNRRVLDQAKILTPEQRMRENENERILNEVKYR